MLGYPSNFGEYSESFECTSLRNYHSSLSFFIILPKLSIIQEGFNSTNESAIPLNKIQLNKRLINRELSSITLDANLI